MTLPSPPLSPAAPPAVGAASAWWSALRPKTLPAAATPVLVGSACSYAGGALRWAPAAACLAGALLLQVASNLANDVYDFEKGADTPARLGPRRAVQSGWISPGRMKAGLVAVLALAALVGCYLIALAGPWMALTGLACMAAAVAYTAGPYPLGYHGLGDVCVFVFFGLVAVVGTDFVMTGQLRALPALASIPIGCLATNILVVNNLRDESTDRNAGKATVVVRWGRRFGLAQYAGLLAAAYLAPLSLLAIGPATPWLALPWLSAPLAVGLVRAVWAREGAELNPLLGQSARLLLVFGALLAGSIALGLEG